MKNSEVIRIAVAESSVIIRSGLTLVLKRLPNLRIQPIELASVEALNDCMRTQPPHILFVNPGFGDYFDVSRFRNDPAGKNVRLVALATTFIDASILNKYDASVSIFDDVDVLTKKISNLQNIHDDEEDENSETLSLREKEIVICVVKGMTNKEIAEKLFLSIHTVITHRRNVSRKLQIHSAAGLTIYAIVNKLVELSDIKDL
ncbi:response regulator transcription factor [Bacteroides sp. 224]|uniref:response regulator transcription factor n=1 Tax=Bacteroides sp. 224 TaxID=2302936 RepID=UPI0013D3F83A|nr:LuxR C-terminal-related transcriptional regulator [Bacteroides sp. 224]NDV65115.1 DNA-binding response regulator [Bacteroides sp. 224]